MKRKRIAWLLTLFVTAGSGSVAFASLQERTDQRSDRVASDKVVSDRVVVAQKVLQKKESDVAKTAFAVVQTKSAKAKMAKGTTEDIEMATEVVTLEALPLQANQELQKKRVERIEGELQKLKVQQRAMAELFREALRDQEAKAKGREAELKTQVNALQKRVERIEGELQKLKVQQRAMAELFREALRDQEVKAEGREAELKTQVNALQKGLESRQQKIHAEQPRQLEQQRKLEQQRRAIELELKELHEKYLKVQNRAWVGVETKAIDPVIASQLKLGGGVVVRSVAKDSPAHQAKVQPHDIILKFGDHVVSKPDDVKKIVSTTIGKKVPVELLRKGDTIVLEVEPELMVTAENVHLFTGNVGTVVPEQLSDMSLWLSRAKKGGEEMAFVAPGVVVGQQKGKVIEGKVIAGNPLPLTGTYPLPSTPKAHTIFTQSGNPETAANVTTSSVGGLVSGVPVSRFVQSGARYFTMPSKDTDYYELRITKKNNEKAVYFLKTKEGTYEFEEGQLDKVPRQYHNFIPKKFPVREEPELRAIFLGTNSQNQNLFSNQADNGTLGGAQVAHQDSMRYGNSRKRNGNSLHSGAQVAYQDSMRYGNSRKRNDNSLHNRQITILAAKEAADAYQKLEVANKLSAEHSGKNGNENINARGGGQYFLRLEETKEVEQRKLESEDRLLQQSIAQDTLSKVLAKDHAKAVKQAAQAKAAQVADQGKFWTEIELAKDKGLNLKVELKKNDQPENAKKAEATSKGTTGMNSRGTAGMNSFAIKLPANRNEVEVNELRQKVKELELLVKELMKKLEEKK